MRSGRSAGMCWCSSGSVSSATGISGFRCRGSVGLPGAVLCLPLVIHREKAVERVPFDDPLGDPGVLLLLVQGCLDDLGGEVGWNDDDAVAVADDDVPGLDRGAAAG